MLAVQIAKNFGYDNKGIGSYPKSEADLVLRCNLLKHEMVKILSRWSLGVILSDLVMQRENC
jgi:hypothetical protein